MSEQAIDSSATEKLAAPAQRGFSDRRCEPRLPCDATPAQIRTDSCLLPAKVMDISRTGIRLEVEAEFPVDSELTVYLNNIIAVVEVRYCRANRNGSFDIGLRIQDVIDPVLPTT